MLSSSYTVIHDCNYSLIAMFLAVLYAIAFLFVFIYLKCKFFKSKKEKMLLKVDGPSYHPIFGNTFQLLVKREDRLNALLNIFKSFPKSDLVRLWIGGIPTAFICKAEAAEELLSSHRWIRKGYRYQQLKSWLGDGVLISDGAKWKERRRLLTPAFHFGILEKFLLTMNEQAVVFINSLEEHVNNQAFDFYPHSTRYTLDTICETAMGSSSYSTSIEKSEYVNHVNEYALYNADQHYYTINVIPKFRISRLLIHRVHRPWLNSDFIYSLSSYGKQHQFSLDRVHEFTRNIILERKNEYIESKKKGNSGFDLESDEIYGKKRRLAFMDLLIHSNLENGDIDDEGIQEEVDTFMFEGHDTTASGLSWAIYNIGRFPEIQKKIVDELYEILGSDRIEYISSNQLNQLKYLECVIKESMRLFPPVPFHSRQLTEDATISGMDIPAGTVIALGIMMIHTDPKHFPDPMTFNPDRFLINNSANRHPYSFVPFAAGPRNCIGQKFAMMELKTAVAHILHQFHVTSIYDNENDLLSYSELILRPVNGHWIRLAKRTMQ